MYNEDTMEYTFSWGWFLVGIIILVLGGLLTRYYQWTADNFGGGLGSYERFKLAGLIGCGVGFVVMLNLHTLILYFVLDSIFPG